MTRLVLKFGGTSLSTAQTFENIFKIIIKNQDILIVVSANSGSTNTLVKIANNLDNKFFVEKLFNEYKLHEEELNVLIKISNDSFTPIFEEIANIINSNDISTPQLTDLIVSYGEIISMNRLYHYLNRFDLDCVKNSSYDLGFITDSNFGNATLLKESFSQIEEIVKKINNKIIITTGFIGKDHLGNITTIGRGGSDLSASLFGVAIKTNEIQIWSDTAIQTCDPRTIKNTKTIHELSFIEALELSFFGAKILHPKTIEPLLNTDCVLKVLNTFDLSIKGTVILKNINRKYRLPVGISYSQKNTIVHIFCKENIVSSDFMINVFTILKKFNMQFSMVSTSKTSISIALQDNQYICELSKFFNVKYDTNFSVICIVGESLCNSVGMASTVFKTVARFGINIEMISQSASQTNIAFVVKDDDCLFVTQQLHDKFF